MTYLKCIFVQRGSPVFGLRDRSYKELLSLVLGVWSA